MRLTSILYGFYARGERLSRGFRQRITEGGWFMLIATFVIGLSGIDTHWSLHYQIFAIMLMILFLGVVSLMVAPRPRLTVGRRCPHFATAGVDLSYTVTVVSRGRRDLWGVRLREGFADALPSKREFVTRPEPRERERNLFDRTFVYYRWMWLVETKKLARSVVSEPLDIEAGDPVRVRLRLRPLRRGRLVLRDMRLVQRDACGLFQRLVRVEDGQESLLILPKRYPVGQIDLLGRCRLDDPGLGAAAPSLSHSDEFVGLRDYRPGDPPRHIHWRSWARLNRPVVKEYEEEQLPRFALALDTVMDPDRDPEYFEEAVSVAASFVAGLDTRDSLLEFLFVADEAYHFSMGGPGASRASEKMLEVLAMVEPGVDRGVIGKLKRSLLDRASALSAAIVVFPEWDVERETLMRALRERGIQCVALVISELAREPEPGVFFLPLDRVGEALAALQISLGRGAFSSVTSG